LVSALQSDLGTGPEIPAWRIWGNQDLCR
jgi:hypothetical protein